MPHPSEVSDPSEIDFTGRQNNRRKGRRAEQITADFMALFGAHLDELFAGRANFRMSTSQYAAKLFINKRHLTNTLKATTGKSPCEFMENAIADEAKRLLRETNLSVSDISSRFAWDEPTNFVKFFKGMVGQTPLQFRKKNS
ncbi:helix-turn-helix domain-containing protein [Flavobacterium selenitireducens]|uniref:helix-turn-helix domain-containing protein n=1 Tax=Flavobacterium selenitireducens TaxID=2722704 RepID=UPI00168BB78D|nr:helix-turn-helix domain-containing protein [Flavobacterium selenitireducens]MBD3582874.1 AraC family transcriptional regulator [Flavobacterium selenitireducens]